MGKLHRVSYGEIFGRKFSTSKIDRHLQDLEVEEKLIVLDNVIDYIYVNLKELSIQNEKRRLRKQKPKKKDSDSESEKEEQPEESSSDLSEEDMQDLEIGRSPVKNQRGKRGKS